VADPVDLGEGSEEACVGPGDELGARTLKFSFIAPIVMAAFVLLDELQLFAPNCARKEGKKNYK
jgi:hypothetical protein